MAMKTPAKITSLRKCAPYAMRTKPAAIPHTVPAAKWVAVHCGTINPRA